MFYDYQYCSIVFHLKYIKHFIMSILLQHQVARSFELLMAALHPESEKSDFWTQIENSNWLEQVCGAVPQGHAFFGWLCGHQGIMLLWGGIGKLKHVVLCVSVTVKFYFKLLVK